MDGGLGPVEFEVQTPVDNVGLCANVRHALGLGLPEMRDFEYPRREPLTIVANGPSALNPALERDGHNTLAINGALKLWSEKDGPDYWAACDPQPIVTDFLTSAPLNTTYFIASKCHPAVFERLAKHRVVLWHIDDDATRSLLWDRDRFASATTVTTCALELGARLGYRRFHTWGWDSCYNEAGNSHAQPQPHVPNDVYVELPDGRSFHTTHTWVVDVQDASVRLIGFPFPVHIHGGGFAGAALALQCPRHVRED